MRTPILVFAGPSLSPAMRPAGPFDWRGPASAGDILALVEDPPERLCLIDGLFDSCPAPWHKEILLLMAQGTLVFGASSMGALRAAELHRFGMIGVGIIFRAYRDGRLTGDDEVALVHASEALDWAPLTVPMVEVRATLLSACRARSIAPDTGRRILRLVRDIHFAERDWPAMERACCAAGVDQEAVRRLQAMHVPLKRRDGLACLSIAREWSEPPAMAAPPPATCFLKRLTSEVRRREAPSPRHRPE